MPLFVIAVNIWSLGVLASCVLRFLQVLGGVLDIFCVENACPDVVGVCGMPSTVRWCLHLPQHCGMLLSLLSLLLMFLLLSCFHRVAVHGMLLPSLLSLLLLSLLLSWLLWVVVVLALAIIVVVVLVAAFVVDIIVMVAVGAGVVVVAVPTLVVAALGSQIKTLHCIVNFE